MKKIVMMLLLVFTLLIAFNAYALYSKGKCYRLIKSSFGKPATIVCNNGKKITGVYKSSSSTGQTYVEVGNKAYWDSDAKKFCGCN